MSLRTRKSISLMIAVFVAFGMLVVGTGEINAASDGITANVSGQTGDNKIYVGEKGQVYAYADDDQDLSIKSVTVNNKKIAKVKKETEKIAGKKYKIIYIAGKKPGKVTVSVKYDHNGTINTKKIKVKVIKSPKMIKSLKVNGKEISVKGDNSFCYKVKCKKTKVNIELVPAKGWKINAAFGPAWYVKDGEYRYDDFQNLEDKTKKGKDIKFAKKYESLRVNIIMLNKKGKVIQYAIDFYR